VTDQLVPAGDRSVTLFHLPSCFSAERHCIHNNAITDLYQLPYFSAQYSTVGLMYFITVKTTFSLLLIFICPTGFFLLLNC